MGQQPSSTAADDAFISRFEGDLHGIVLQDSIREKLAEWVHSSKSINIFVTGKTGSGKSTLVNALIGEKKAAEGARLDPMTAKVSCYKTKIAGIQVNVWDSPGLQDSTGKEENYIKDMKAKFKIEEIDLCLFCINISATRLSDKEFYSMQKLTAAFGPSFWAHSVVALTFANEIKERDDDISRLAKKISKKVKEEDHEKAKEELSKLFQAKIAEWDKELRKTLSDLKVDPSLVKGLTIVPTGFRSDPSLPDRDYWLTTFWFAALQAMHHRAQPAMLRINYSRIIEEPESVSLEDRKKFYTDQSLVFKKQGQSIGKEIGQPDLGEHIGQHIAEALGVRMAIAAGISLIMRLLLMSLLKMQAMED